MNVDILAIGAHPDDAEIGCAGLLLKAKAQGLRTGILVLTQGEKGHFGDQETRAREAATAAEILQVDEFHMLDLPDARLEMDYESALRITEFLKRMRPKLVLTPHFDDHHPDHRAVPCLTERASYLATRRGVLPQLEPLFPQPKHLTFPLSFQRPCSPTFVLDITDVYGVKRKALKAHSSQFTPILFAVETAARYYGMMITAAYGEGFLHKGPLRLTEHLSII
jgi:bacillithiol biosynthesis deacetylase BshB1